MSLEPSDSDPNLAKADNSGTSGESDPGLTDGDERFRAQIKDASTAAFRRVEARTPPSLAGRLRRFRERLRRNRGLDTAWRVMVFAIGATLLLAGLIMFVIPGPGFATIILGLVVLASEFTWANRALAPVKEAAQRASAAAMDPRRRRRNLTFAAIGGVLVGIALVWYLLTYGLTIDPLVEWAHGLVDWVTGLFE